MQETAIEKQESIHKGIIDSKGKSRTPWLWVPSLYFAEGIPYIIAMTASVIMYKNLGIANDKIAFWTSLLYLPWVIKPLWSPLVVAFSTKRHWIWLCQLLLGFAFIGVTLVLPLSSFFWFSLILLWVVAFVSATHDIAADGFYLLGLSTHQQAWFVGVRSSFYRLAMLMGQGLLVMFAGFIQSQSGLPPVEIVTQTDTSAVHTQSMPQEFNQPTTLHEDLRILAFPDTLIFPVQSASMRMDSQEVFFRLSRPMEAGKEIVVMLNRSEGSKDFTLKSGSRLVFNQENWYIPQSAAIQLDSKVSYQTRSFFKATSGNIVLSWSLTFAMMASMFLFFAFYHKLFLPHPVTDQAVMKGRSVTSIIGAFKETFFSFFDKKDIVSLLLFLLLYRFAESQLVKLASPFLMDGLDKGGLGLSTGQVGLAYGTVGLATLTIGGILGGILVARHGLKKWLWPMALAINLPDLVYVYLSATVPDNFLIVIICVAIEQLGYGLGFTAYMMVMIYASKGKFETAHYAIATGFMALGMMIPGMFSGIIQQAVGYRTFFIWVNLAVLFALIPVFFIKIDPEFGKK